MTFSSLNLPRFGIKIPLVSYVSSDGVPYFPVLVCRNCGEAYIEAWDDGSFLSPKATSGGSRAVLRLARTGVALDDEEENDGEELAETISVDSRTGRVTEIGDGVVVLQRAVMEDDEDERRTYMKRCSCCGAETAELWFFRSINMS